MIFRFLGVVWNESEDYLHNFMKYCNTWSNFVVIVLIHFVIMDDFGILSICQCATAQSSNSCGRFTAGASGRLR